MPTDLYYTTGQAARKLGVSQATMRALCASGAIEFDTTSGGQYRIAQSAVDRLEREGIPETPRPLPANAPRRTTPRHGHPALLAEPSGDVIESAEDVVAAENRVKKRRLDRELEETEDWFRERDEREAARIEAQDREERERRRQAEAEQIKSRWLQEWTDHALSLIPWDAPQDSRLEVAEAARRALAAGDPYQPDTLTGRLVEAAVARALSPWRRSKEIREAIEQACSGLPWDMRRDDEWKHRATRAAGEAIAKLRDGAGAAEMEAGAALALKPLVAEYEHRKRCQEIADSVWRLLPGATYDELEQGKEAIAEALGKLPVGTSQRQMDAACEEALEPLRAVIAERQDQEMREAVIRDAGWSLALAGVSGEDKEDALHAVHDAVDALPQGAPKSDVEQARERVVERCKQAQDRKEQKARLIEDGLQGIYAYIGKLLEKWDFEGKSAWTLEQEIKDPIRAQLEEELSGKEPEEQVRGRVRRLVREELEL